MNKRIYTTLITLLVTASRLYGADNGYLAPTVLDGDQSTRLSTPLKLVAIDKLGVKVDLAIKPGWKVVYFWSDACPCVAACQQYSFLPLAKKYAGKVSFYGIVSGKYDLDQPPALIRAHIAEQHLPYPVLMDLDHSVATALGAQVTPQTFLLNPKNEIVFSGMPDDSRRYLGRTGKSGVTQTYLSKALAQALAGKTIKRPKTDNQGCIISW